MDFTVIKFSGQGSFKVKKGTIDKLLFFSENHRHLPITSVNDPSNVPKISSSKIALCLAYKNLNHKTSFPSVLSVL